MRAVSAYGSSLLYALLKAAHLDIPAHVPRDDGAFQRACAAPRAHSRDLNPRG